MRGRRGGKRRWVGGRTSGRPSGRTLNWSAPCDIFLLWQLAVPADAAPVETNCPVIFSAGKIERVVNIADIALEIMLGQFNSSRSRPRGLAFNARQEVTCMIRREVGNGKRDTKKEGRNVT